MGGSTSTQRILRFVGDGTQPSIQLTHGVASLSIGTSEYLSFSAWSPHNSYGLMPEGDTLRHAEAALTPVLEGEVATGIWFRKIRGHVPRVGQRIEGVDAVGKNLLIAFDRHLTLHTHLGMSGSWRTIEAQAPIPRSPQLRIVIATAQGKALCFAAPVIQTFLRTAPSSSPLARLGPDLSDDGTDLPEVLRRTRLTDPNRKVAEVLLDQRIACGVGNVFKSEALFVAQLHPFVPLGALSDECLIHLWAVAHQQLVANRDRRGRVTTGQGDRPRTFVYGRQRLSCLRCSNSISFSPAGERTQRSTYWCPSCQPA